MRKKEIWRKSFKEAEKRQSLGTVGGNQWQENFAADFNINAYRVYGSWIHGVSRADREEWHTAMVFYY